MANETSFKLNHLEVRLSMVAYIEEETNMFSVLGTYSDASGRICPVTLQIIDNGDSETSSAIEKLASLSNQKRSLNGITVVVDGDLLVSGYVANQDPRVSLKSSMRCSKIRIKNESGPSNRLSGLPVVSRFLKGGRNQALKRYMEGLDDQDAGPSSNSQNPSGTKRIRPNPTSLDQLEAEEWSLPTSEGLSPSNSPAASRLQGRQLQSPASAVLGLGFSGQSLLGSRPPSALERAPSPQVSTSGENLESSSRSGSDDGSGVGFGSSINKGNRKVGGPRGARTLRSTDQEVISEGKGK
ncbi:hypothetical protein BGX27_002297, partial [Mortierella sp. AM989]